MKSSRCAGSVSPLLLQACRSLPLLESDVLSDFHLAGGIRHPNGLAALGGTFNAGLRHYRHYREERGQAESQAFLARGDYRNAALSARKTLALNPNNVPACRVLPELANRSNSPLALDWMRRVVQNEPTVENKFILASAGLKYQKPPFPLTVQILMNSRPPPPTAPAIRWSPAVWPLYAPLRRGGSPL